MMSMAWAPTERSRWFLALVNKALMRAGVSQKEAALAQGLSQTQWSRQMRGLSHSHPSLARFGELNNEVLEALAEEICKATGGACFVRHEKLVELIVKVEVLAEKVKP